MERSELIRIAGEWAAYGFPQATPERAMLFADFYADNYPEGSTSMNLAWAVFNREVADYTRQSQTYVRKF